MKSASVKKLSSPELSYFCAQISMILKSGILISDGIDWMYDDIEDGNVKQVLNALRKELSKKVPLHKAMENTNCFPSYLITMARIGSTTGSLEEVMSSLSEFYDRDTFLKSKIHNSIFYPFMLFLMMSVVIAILVIKIFPIFEGMMRELGDDASYSTSMIIGKISLFIVAAIIIFTCVMYILSRSKKGKKTINKFVSKFIVTKSIMTKITAYRFASCMSLLLSSGMNIESSVNMLLDIVEEPTLKGKIDQCSKSMSSGDEFIESLSKLNMFSGIHLQMLSMGQRTGEMDVVMKKLTNIYENEADQSINRAVSLIEPVLVGALCLVIGFILISVMLPLMNIMSSIG